MRYGKLEPFILSKFVFSVFLIEKFGVIQIGGPFGAVLSSSDKISERHSLRTYRSILFFAGQRRFESLKSYLELIKINEILSTDTADDTQFEKKI